MMVELHKMNIPEQRVDIQVKQCYCICRPIYDLDAGKGVQ